MKVLIDLNVMLDLLQRREPFFEHAASVLDSVLLGSVVGVLPAHVVTSLSYFLEKGAPRERVIETIRWILGSFEIVATDRGILEDAVAMGLPDYEDAVVMVSALRTQCTYIVTRNTRDFEASPVSAIEPIRLVDILKTS